MLIERVQDVISQVLPGVTVTAFECEFVIVNNLHAVYIHICGA